MQYANSLFGEKIRAFKNGKAICPICDSTVTAKCGEIYIDHWAHLKNNDCDSWSEPLSEWHINWQNHFKKEQIEVVISKNNEMHRADIVTNSGVVIEIQNSAISTEKIKERENFYNKMIWVINAEKFKHNIQFRNYLYDINELNRNYINPYHSFTYNDKSVIKVPENNNKVILKALKECEYVEYYDKSEVTPLVYYKESKRYYQKIDRPVYNSLVSYLIDCELSKYIDVNSTELYDTKFNWKYFRFSWFFANSPIFLDLNNGYLFYINKVNEYGLGQGKIITKTKFLDKYVNI